MLNDEIKPSEWKTREGEILKVSEMGDDHLLNAIFYLGRRVKLLARQKEWVDDEHGNSGWVRRGKKYPEVFYTMLNEAKKRGFDICERCPRRYRKLLGECEKCYLHSKKLL